MISAKKTKMTSSEHYLHPDLSNKEALFSNMKKKRLSRKRIFTFHCWKCGTLMHIDLIDKPETVKCWQCGTILTIPKE
jgi:DNA-directed RNA polymerase subunit RPC12/RpoP